MTIYGPLGNFTLPTLDHPLVMFASGVGITPLRALIQDALSQKTTTPIELIFTAHDYHLYQADFEAWAAQHANFHLHIVKNRQAAQAALLATTQHYGNTADYFLSGSETVVDAVQTFLTTTGAINADQIHRDVLYDISNVKAMMNFGFIIAFTLNQASLNQFFRVLNGIQSRPLSRLSATIHMLKAPGFS